MERTVLDRWYTPSSRGDRRYETRVYTDGSTACDCPGWRYVRNGQPRHCKHLRDLAPEIAAALERQRRPPRLSARSDPPRQEPRPEPPPTPQAPAPDPNPRRQRAISFEEDPE